MTTNLKIQRSSGECVAEVSLVQKAFALLERLRDGQVHSGEDIAAQLGVTRAAIWNQVKRLRAEGVEVHAVSGKGYRLPGGYEFLDQQLIELALSDAGCRAIRSVRVERITNSTNQRLLDAIGDVDIHGAVWLAEYQSRGRGRRGGSWLAPPGSGLCLSLGWCFDSPPASLSALGLVVGVALVRALTRLGARDLKLKWPNDIYHEEHKLGGILIEMRSEFSGPCTVVIGVGINVALTADARARINEPITDIAASCREVLSRNIVAAAIINELAGVLDDFKQTGFTSYREEWQRYDMLAGRPLQLEMTDKTVAGVGCGVGPEGMLLIEKDGKIESFLSGHIVLDPQP